MKKLFLTLLLLLIFPVFAFANPTPTANITFVWDANTDTVTGYRFYQFDYSIAVLDTNDDGIISYEELLVAPGELANSRIADIPVGTETVTIQAEDGKWYWFVTAYNSNGESGPSNEVTDTIDTSVPHAPGGLNITIIIKIN